MTNEVIDLTKQTVQEVVQPNEQGTMPEVAKDVIKDFAKGIGENTKLDISLQGPSAATFMSILSICAAGTICYGIYTWGKVQKSHENEA